MYHLLPSRLTKVLLKHGMLSRILLHTIIKASGLPSFLGLRIPVSTNLNAWIRYLCNYFDQQLVDLIEYSFCFDFDRTRKLEGTLRNRASARNYPTHVDYNY